MSCARTRVTAALVAVAASAMVFGQASAALADDHRGGNPVLVVSPAPGKITKEHKVTDTYQYDPKASGSSEEPPPGGGGSSPQLPEPGPVTNAKDTVNSAAQSATSGAASTVDSALK